jgi:hypothetical protein
MVSSTHDHDWRASRGHDLKSITGLTGVARVVCNTTSKTSSIQFQRREVHKASVSLIWTESLNATYDRMLVRRYPFQPLFSLKRAKLC